MFILQTFFLKTPIFFISEVNSVSLKIDKTLATYIPANLKDIVQKIKNETNVPILLPKLFEIKRNTRSFYGTGSVGFDKSSYSICQDQTPFSPCINGSVISKKTLDGYQIFKSMYSYPETSMCHPKKDQNWNNRSGFITLSRGVKGFYYEPFSKTNCGYPEITWRLGNYQYSVFQKWGQFEELVELANSAIDNQS